jgi:hypothetical protein
MVSGFSTGAVELRTLRQAVAVLIVACGPIALDAAQAADAVRGKALFANTNGAPQSCASAACHSGFPTVQRNKIANGSNPTVILNAIAANTGGMKLLSGFVSTTDANDIAAYIANPSAGAGAPALALSVATLTFASQTLGTTSVAQTVTVSNPGTAVLTLSALTFSGGASAEFARAGTCQAGSNIAAGASCTLQITFTPAVAGARSAALTISHNASGGASTVQLAGTGALAPAVASVSPPALSFTQTINTTSAAQVVTVGNTGGQPLTLGSIAVSGTNAAEFLIGAASTCAAGAVVNGGASCSLQMSFRPAAAGARTASLSIAHSASASPLTATLTGTGTVTAQPAISASPTALSFGTVSVGQKSTAQSVTLTNSGQAPLTLASLTLGGSASGDFALAGDCTVGAAMAPGGSCSMQLTFAPTTVGVRSASVTVTSNAANGNPVVTLSGSAAQYALAVNPVAATLQSTVGTMSAPLQAVVTNSGASAITLSAITVTGPFSVQQGSNACGAGPIDLVPGQSCNIYVAFMPDVAGTASGEILVASASLPAPTRIALTALASAPQTGASSGSTPTAPAQQGSSAVAPSNVGGGGCTVGPADQLIDPLLAVMLGAALFEVLRRKRKPR